MTHKPVNVAINLGGQFLEDMTSLSTFAGILSEGLVDFRWSPWIVKVNEYEIEAHPHVLITIDKWFLTENGIQYMSNHLRNDDNLQNQLMGNDVGERLYCVNAVLSVMNHFGPDYPYDKKFLQRVESVLGDIFLYSFHEESKDDFDPLTEPLYKLGESRSIPRQANRVFHGKTYTRRQFFDVLNDIFDKVGI